MVEDSNKMMLEYRPDLLVFKNEGADKVDALPYIDAEIDAEAKLAVGALIGKEMKAMRKSGVLQEKNYLEGLEMPDLQHIESDFIK